MQVLKADKGNTVKQMRQKYNMHIQNYPILHICVWQNNVILPYKVLWVPIK